MPKKQTQQGATAKGRGTAKKRPTSSSTRSPQKKRSVSAIRAARWWLIPVAISVGLALFVLAYYPVARVQYRAVRERARLQAELQAINDRNARLQKRVDALRTPEGIEEEARRQFGMVNAGESMGIVLDGDEVSGTKPVVPRIDSDEVTVGPTGAWTAFLDGVFGVSQ